MNNKFKNVITLGGFIITLIIAGTVIIMSNYDDGELQLSEGTTAISWDETELVSGDSGEMKIDEDDTKKLIVFVLGAVNEPGVVQVNEGARLYDVLELAGGAVSDADLGKVNLAEFVWDEEKIVIPYRTEIKNNTTTKASNISTVVVVEPKENVEPPKLDYGADYFNNYDVSNDVDFKVENEKENDSKSSTNKVININTASETELTKLTGIGSATAKKIIEYRETNGKFKSIEDLKKVKGIGDAKFNKIKDNITI